VRIGFRVLTDDEGLRLDGGRWGLGHGGRGSLRSWLRILRRDGNEQRGGTGEPGDDAGGKSQTRRWHFTFSMKKRK
jgi:hypothetical protein